jgi:hypothetical protein
MDGWTHRIKALCPKSGELSGVVFSLYIVPLDPALKGGDCGVLPVHKTKGPFRSFMERALFTLYEILFLRSRLGRRLSFAFRWSLLSRVSLHPKLEGFVLGETRSGRNQASHDDVLFQPF